MSWTAGRSAALLTRIKSNRGYRMSNAGFAPACRYLAIWEAVSFASFYLTWTFSSDVMVGTSLLISSVMTPEWPSFDLA